MEPRTNPEHLVGEKQDGLKTESDQIRGTVLLIEDDAPTRRLLRAAFNETGIKLIESDNGLQGVDLAATKAPDLVLLDLGLPDITGQEIVQILRSWSMVPIIILSAQGQDHKKVACLEAGADDYITKPFSIAELVARVRASLRRAAQVGAEGHSTIFEYEGLRIDLAARDTFLDGDRVHLTPLEFKLLSVLVRHVGRVVTHTQLLTEVWGPDFATHAQYLRLYVGYLRKKLENGDSGRKFIYNEPGVGYRFAE